MPYQKGQAAKTEQLQAALNQPSQPSQDSPNSAGTVEPDAEKTA